MEQGILEQEFRHSHRGRQLLGETLHWLTHDIFPPIDTVILIYQPGKKVGKAILVVDDFASYRAFVCEMLRGKGYETFCAGNGEEAFRILLEKAEQINAVLTDYHMPDGSGLDLLKKIKGTTSVAKVPVVFLTSEANPEAMRSAEEAGLFAWVNKPYRSEVLFAKIELAMGNRGEA